MDDRSGAIGNIINLFLVFFEKHDFKSVFRNNQIKNSSTTNQIRKLAK